MHRLVEMVECFQIAKKTWPGGASPKPGHLARKVAEERLLFLKEELQEFEDALDKNDLAEQGDALLDLIYVAVGTGLMMGLPLAEMMGEVQRANMEKVQVNAPGYKGGLVKPVNWVPPDHETILARRGYQRDEWVDESGCLKDGVGYDRE